MPTVDSLDIQITTSATSADRKTDFDKTKDKNKEWCEADCKPILFGMKQCKDFTTLVITEGQIDTLSVAMADIYNVVCKV